MEWLANFAYYVAVAVMSLLLAVGAIYAVYYLWTSWSFMYTRRWVKYKIAWFFSSIENASSSILMWVLAIYIASNLLLGRETSLQAWSATFQNRWNIVGYSIAFTIFAIIIVIIVRGIQELSPEFRRFAKWMTIVMLAAITVLPFLWHWVPIAMDGSLSLWPSSALRWLNSGNEASAPATTPRKDMNPANIQQPQVIPYTGIASPGNHPIGNETLMVITPTPDKQGGWLVLTAPVGARYQICYVEGHFDTFNFSSQSYSPQRLQGSVEGFVKTFRDKDSGKEYSWDWSSHYQYDGRTPGALPDAVLVVMGKIGSHRETVFPFSEIETRSGQYCVTVTNDTGTAQPLTLFYNALKEFWLGSDGRTIYPSQEEAYKYRDFKARRISGWNDRGKIKFMVTPLQ